MLQPWPRPLPSIDADLLAYRAFRRGATSELAEVRRRQAELADLEAALIVAVEARRSSVDRLLDERLLACASVEQELPSLSETGDGLGTVASYSPHLTGTTAPQRLQHAPR